MLHWGTTPFIFFVVAMPTLVAEVLSYSSSFVLLYNGLNIAGKDVYGLRILHFQTTT